MDKSDIEFTVGLNTSPAEQQLSNLYKDVKSHNDRIQRLLANPKNFSEQKYTSDLSKLETMYGKYGNGSGTSVGNFTKSQYEVFSKLIASVAKYEYEMERIAQRGSSIMSSVNTYSTNKNRVDAHPGMFNERLKSVTDMELERLEIERNKAVARGSYETWKNLTSDNILALPAPKTETKEKNTDTAIQEEKEVVEENKKDNTELNDKILKWGKIAAIVYAIKKVLEGLSKVWKFGAETITSRNANLDQDLGFFSIDPEGAMRANVDTTRAVLYAGIRNMGENSPVSKEGLDYTAQKFTELWTAAMSGREVDARTTIDAQRLKEFFGIDLTVAGLLTGQREGKTATDIQLDVMKKVEAQLEKLNEVDQTTKGQVIDSLRNILGDEMVNAIVANFNKNARIDNSETRLTVAEKLEQAGGSALNLRDFTEKTTNAVLSLSRLKDSLEELKNTLVEDLAPAFTSVTDALTSFVDWINRKMTKTETDTVTPGGLGSTKPLNKDLKSTDEGDVFGTKPQRKASAREKLKTAKNADEVLDAIYELNPNLMTEGSIEALKQQQYINDAYDALASGTLDENSTNPFERYLANYEYGGLKGLPALQLAEKKGVFGKGWKGGQWVFREAIKGKRLQRPQREDYWAGPIGALAFKNASNEYQNWLDFFYNSKLFADFATGEFGEGGASDWGEGKGKFNYLVDPSYFKTADAWYDALKRYKEEMKDFGSEYIKSFNLPSKESLWGEDKKLQFEEVVFRLELTDGRVVDSVRRTPEEVIVGSSR